MEWEPTTCLFLGSFPPRECGIATFTKDVVDSYDSASMERARSLRSKSRAAKPASIADRRREAGARRSRFIRGARALRQPASLRALNIQHEYGLFGGEDGEWIVDLIALVRKPVIVSLHTVLPDPSPNHLRVARTICATASSSSSSPRPGKHSAHALRHRSREGRRDPPRRPGRRVSRKRRRQGDARVTQPLVISTFGLISRGKGLEYAIEAMRDIVAQHPEALYLILGQTHRSCAAKRAKPTASRSRNSSPNTGSSTTFAGRPLSRIRGIGGRILQATDIYLTPYLNPVQIVSGTLAYAVGLGKAVVSTPYLYAEELLAHGRGFLVQFRDALSIGTTINALSPTPTCAEHRTPRLPLRPSDDVAARGPGIRPAVRRAAARAPHSWRRRRSPRAELATAGPRPPRWR